MAEFDANSRARYESAGGDLPESETEYFYSRRASMDEFSDSGAAHSFIYEEKMDRNESENFEEKKLESQLNNQPMDCQDYEAQRNTPVSRPLSRSSFVFVASE